MKTNKLIMLKAMFFILSGISIITVCEQSNKPQEKIFFNKNVKSCQENQKKGKEKIESNIADIISGKTKSPRIFKYFVTTYREDIKDTLLWANEFYNSKDMAEYKDEKEALNELTEDAERISKENELSLWHSRAAYLCAGESWERQTPACKNLAQAYDSFRFHSQDTRATKIIKSIDHQISIHYDCQHTVAFLEKAKRLQEDLRKTNAPLFNTLNNSVTETPLSNNSSYFESLSAQDKKALTSILETVVLEKITNTDDLAQEFQKLFYVFHEKAARKHLNEQEAFRALRNDIQRNNYSYASTVHSCELETAYTHSVLNSTYNKSTECKKLAQAYNNWRAYSNIHEIKERDSIQKQINDKSRIFTSIINPNNVPTIAFLTEKKEKLEQEIKDSNNGIIPTKIPSYYDQLSDEDKKELTDIIKNVVNKKITQPDRIGEEFQQLFDVFNEKI